MEHRGVMCYLAANVGIPVGVFGGSLLLFHGRSEGVDSFPLPPRKCLGPSAIAGATVMGAIVWTGAELPAGIAQGHPANRGQEGYWKPPERAPCWSSSPNRRGHDNKNTVHLLERNCPYRSRPCPLALLVAGSCPVSAATEAPFGASPPNPAFAVGALGLHWRSANLVAAAAFVKGRLDGQVPDSWQELVAIPGVGDYIASAVLCFAFGRSSVMMDTNTQRIARSVLGEGLLQPNWRPRLSLRELAGPKGPNTQWNQALLGLGALVCKARAPVCAECPVRTHCATGGRR